MTSNGKKEESKMHTQPTLIQASRPSSRSFVIGFSPLVSLTALFSILVLVFKTDAAVSYRHTTNNGLSIGTSPLLPDVENGGLELGRYPQYLYGMMVKPTLVAAGVSLILALSVGLLFVFVRRRDQALLLSNRQRLGMFFALGGNCVLVLIVSIISLVHRFQSARFEPRYRSPATHYQTYGPFSTYDQGTFDLGSWSCQLRAYGAFNDKGQVLSRQCIDETAALWMSLLLVLSNLGMAGLVWMDWREQKEFIRDSKALQDEYDVDSIGDQGLFT